MTGEGAKMANRRHIKRLREGAESWNNWYSKALVRPDLGEAEMVGCDLSGASLVHGNLIGAKLAGAKFEGADLNSANFDDADLSGASLVGATLAFTTFRRTELRGTDFNRAILSATIFDDVNLADVKGLEKCWHRGPCVIDFRTLQRSGSLPLQFLQGIGLPDSIIQYLPSLLDHPIQHYSCFISYSTRDQSFADRIYADLQNKGVRCWFAPHDLPIGGLIIDEIDAAIRLRDKVLLILSENSIKSDWVEDEVTKAFEEERKRGQTVLFPIRLDDAVMDTDEAWAAKLRNRHVGDFRRWKEHDEYQKSFARVLRDLTVKKDG